MRKFFALATGIVCVLTVVIAPPANAEFMSAFSAGYNVTTDEELTINTGTIDEYLTQYDFDNSFIIGYRIGYWLESVPAMGFAIDASYFRPEPDFAFIYRGRNNPPPDPDPSDPVISVREEGKLDIIPITLNLMFRIPLGIDEIYPNGRYQPYVAIGPGLFLSWIDTQNIDDSDAQFGWDARVGFNYMVAHNIGIFAEYRYTDSKFTFDEAIGIGGNRNEFEIDLQTNHYTLGISYFF